MEREDGYTFDCRIPPFSLESKSGPGNRAGKNEREREPTANEKGGGARSVGTLTLLVGFHLHLFSVFNDGYCFLTC